MPRSSKALRGNLFHVGDDRRDFLVGQSRNAFTGRPPSALRYSLHRRRVLLAVGVVVVLAGALQLTAWKARHLACCREMPRRGRTLPADASTAWRHGLRLGLHCTQCCASLVAILLVIGVMDLRAMALATGAITVERLAPFGDRIAVRSAPQSSGQGCS